MTSPEVNHAMNRTIKYLLSVLLLLGTASTLPAQIDTVVRAFIDHAGCNSHRQAQSHPRRNQQPKHQPTTKHASHKFNGRWLATDHKNNAETQQVISRTFTLVI